MIRRIVTIMHKEFLHILRDRRTLATMFLIPIVQLFLLGYAANPNVEHLKTAVLDLDRSARSRDLIAAYQSSNYFDVTQFPGDREAMGRLIDQGEVRAAIVISAGFGEELDRWEHPRVEFDIDGSDPTVANVAFSASQSVGQAFSVDMVRKVVGVDPAEQLSVDLRPRVWYNPEMRSANFMVPGVVGLILQILSMMMTAMAIVREREYGTIEQLIVTPIRPYELILGKVMPYALIVFMNAVGVLVLAVLWFDVPIHGDVLLLLALTAFAMITTLALGLLISTVARSQQEAMLSTYFFMLPSIFLSGYMFPLENMPTSLQFLSNFVPLRYLLVIIRGIILKGIGMDLLMREIAVLGVLSLVILILATTRFRKQLE
jgi:ABC-2 type transport system permease protein